MTEWYLTDVMLAKLCPILDLDHDFCENGEGLWERNGVTPYLMYHLTAIINDAKVAHDISNILKRFIQKEMIRIIQILKHVRYIMVLGLTTKTINIKRLTIQSKNPI